MQCAGMGRDAHGMNHRGFRVVKVERVEYAAAYFAYSAARANTHSGDFNRTDVDIFGSLGHPSPNHPICPPTAPKAPAPDGWTPLLLAVQAVPCEGEAPPSPKDPPRRPQTCDVTIDQMTPKEA